MIPAFRGRAWLFAMEALASYVDRGGGGSNMDNYLWVSYMYGP